MFVEAEANKAGGKYDNASIDYQIDFYRNDGLTPYSEAKLPITSGAYVSLERKSNDFLASYFLCILLYESYSSLFSSVI